MEIKGKSKEIKGARLRKSKGPGSNNSFEGLASHNSSLAPFFWRDCQTDYLRVRVSLSQVEKMNPTAITRNVALP